MSNYYHMNQGKNLLGNINENTPENIKRSISTFLESSLQKEENLTLLIGSGCSSGCIPLMSQTMEKLKNDATISNYIIEYLQKITEKPVTPADREFREFKDIESLMNWMQNGIQYLSAEDSCDLEIALSHLKSEFIDTIPSAGDKIYKLDWRACKAKDHSHAMNLYTDFYRKLFSGREASDPKISIFTTNYDLYNEYALENNNIQYTTGFTTGLTKKFDINNFHYRLVDDTNRYKDKWQPTSKSANLYKIHGSINWKFNQELGLVEETLDPPSPSTTAIYPSAMKHRETAQHPYSELFREFSIQLQRPNTTLVIIGYGFPDEHINNIISQNVTNEDFNLIVFGNISERKCMEFYDKHKDKANFHLIGGSVDGEESNLHYFDSIIELMKDKRGFINTMRQDTEQQSDAVN